MADLANHRGDDGLPDSFRHARFELASIYDAPEWYDVDYAGYRAEEAFYRLVTQPLVGGRSLVLELGAGTGRLTVPLARAGLRVIGVEPSAPMRAVLAERAAREPALGIEIRAGRADDFHIAAGTEEERVSAVLFAFNGLLHVRTRDELMASFRHIRAALSVDGRFAFDVTGPYWEAVAHGSVGWGRLDERVHLRTGEKVFTADRSRYDAAARTMHIDIRYLVAGADRGVEVALVQRMWTWQELLSALGEAGFAVEMLYGDVDLTPFREGAVRMLVCARAA